MENKITALSDDELMEVTGGLVQILNPSDDCCSKRAKKGKEYCEKRAGCTWQPERSDICHGGCT